MKTKILIVEDESLFALELELRLQTLGYDICGIADNSNEAVRLTQIHCPDLILMDIRIKGDVDGIETARIIRKENEIPVIFLTAYSDTETINRAKPVLPYGYLSKPVQARDLQSTIETALYKSKTDYELKRHEEQYRIIKSTDLFGYCLADESGKLLDVNDTYCTMTGYTREELLHLSIPDLDVIENLENVLRRVQKIIGCGKDQFESKHKAKNGRVFDVEVSIAHWPSQKQFIVFIRDITDRKQDEEKIKNSERTYRLLFENNLAGVFTSTVEGVLINCNESFARILDYGSAKELQGCDVHTLYFDPTTRSSFIESLREKGHLDSYELCMTSAAGHPVWVLAATTLIDDKILQGTIVNITERKNYENALRASEQNYHRVVENIDEALIIDDLEGKVVFSNSAFRRLFGISEQELNEIYIEDYIAPEWRDILRERHDRRTKGEEVPSIFEYEGIRKDGTRLWLEVIVAKVIENGKIIGTQSAIRNVTDRRRAEVELRESEEAFRRLFDESADPILLLDETGFTNCNQSAVSILGYSSKEEFLIKQPWDVSPERQPDGMLSSEKAQMMIDQSISKGFHRFEWIHTKADGSEFPVEVMLTPIIVQGKRIIYTVWRDITERKQAEREMNLLLTLTRTITEAGDFDSALAATLRVVSEIATWEFGEAWIPSSDRKYLERSSSWYGKDQSLRNFHEASAAFTFSPNVGLPGRVWASKKPLCIPDVTLDPNFLRAALAKEVGLHTVVGIPIIADHEIVAVICFFFHKLYKKDEKTVMLVTTVAAQLGTLFQRKHAEQALRQSEERNRSLLDAIPDMIFRLDPQGRYIDFKVENTIDLYVMPDQFMGKSYEEVLPEDLREKLRTTIASARSTRKLQTAEYNLPLRGGIQTFEARILVTHDDEIVAVVRNITDRKKSEKTVRQLSSAIEQTADYVIITDVKGIIQYVNASFVTISGFTKEEVVGTKPNILKSGMHAAELYENLWGTILDGKTWRGILVNKKKNGDLFYEEKTISPIFDESGRITQFASTGKDITENKKAEAMLKASESKYRSLFDSSPDMIFLVKEGMITAMNSTFCSLLGYTDENLLRDRQFEKIFVIDQNFQFIVKSLSSGSNVPVFVEGKCQTKKGKWLDVEIGFVAFDLEGASVIHGTARDITEFKVLQEKNNQMQRLASLGQMSATIAHEIRNPLASMILNLRYLRKNLNFSPKYEEVYNDVVTGATRIEGIVSGILQFSKTPVMDMQWHDVCKITSEALSFLSPELEQANIKTNLSFSSRPIFVNCDSGQMIQVFTNLFTNARQAMAKGGQLTVRIDDAGERVNVIIADSGRGIPKEQLANIFDPFFTSRPDGTGLGLAIVSKILLYHNADITVQSEPDKGSHFTITFHQKKNN